MIRLPPLQSARFSLGNARTRGSVTGSGKLSGSRICQPVTDSREFSAWRACEPVAGSREPGGSEACEPMAGSAELGVAVAAPKGGASSLSVGSGAGMNEESSLFQSDPSDDCGNTIAVTAKLRMTSHRPMIYPHLLPTLSGIHRSGPQS